ncbi:glycosyltransferase [Robertkochia aurantiaca]|uniref:glycosyltransferase n=1 Tax=Robertkochia aurantiaca TaxID=2873700 RepID=UPI001CCBED4A|nr:glycosyltransferase [Robertkochia sp. 3YJGBD-33]
MKLSVILPTFNQEKYLSRCLDSLIDQGLSSNDYEIIIVNDGSTDNTVAIAESYMNSFEQIRLLNKKNGGAGAARNAGLKEAKGRYLHFVDPDDYIASNVYPVLLHEAENNMLEILGFGFEKTKKTDLKQSRTDLNKNNLKTRVSSGPEFLARTNYRNTVWWYLISKSFMLENGFEFIEGRWMEDSILTPKMFMQTKRFGYIKIDVYRYMVNPNSAMTSKKPEHYNKLISDIEHATFEFDELLDNIPKNDKLFAQCWQRIKVRQQSFVFFLLVRLMKSNLPIDTIPEKLSKFKDIQAYPLDYFGGKDFEGPAYKILTYIFNRKQLMYPFMNLFRLVYKPIYRIRS